MRCGADGLLRSHLNLYCPDDNLFTSQGSDIKDGGETCRIKKKRVLECVFQFYQCNVHIPIQSFYPQRAMELMKYHEPSDLTFFSPVSAVTVCFIDLKTDDTKYHSSPLNWQNL